MNIEKAALWLAKRPLWPSVLLAVNLVFILPSAAYGYLSAVEHNTIVLAGFFMIGFTVLILLARRHMKRKIMVRA